MLRYLTMGESHGKGVSAVIEGLPAGLPLLREHIDAELAKRQLGYGRGGRQNIEKDRVEFLSGLRHGRTLGSPLLMTIPNRDFINWTAVMSSDPVSGKIIEVTRPRPGHADLSGAMKYDTKDCRNILERSSARETAARVAVGAVARRLLSEFGISVHGWVISIGKAEWKDKGTASVDSLYARAERSDVRCPDEKTSVKMRSEIDAVRKSGNSIGGVFKVVVSGVPPGLGSHVQWDRKLDARLAMALMSIQAIKGVELGLGFDAARTPGSLVHDEIFYSRSPKDKRSEWWPFYKRFHRKTNNAGGTEGGMSNGEDIVLSAAMKPIPTLYKPLRSVDIVSKKPFTATIERSDICAVPAASIVGEAVVAAEIAAAFLEKFGGDSMREIKRNYTGYLKQLSDF